MHLFSPPLVGGDSLCEILQSWNLFHGVKEEGISPPLIKGEARLRRAGGFYIHPPPQSLNQVQDRLSPIKGEDERDVSHIFLNFSRENFPFSSTPEATSKNNALGNFF